MFRPIYALLLGLWLWAPGCSTDSQRPEADVLKTPAPQKQRLRTTPEVAATIRFVDIEGGCWAIDTADGRFEATNLPAEFRTDGRRVMVRLQTLPLEMTSVCQIGPMMAVASIRDL